MVTATIIAGKYAVDYAGLAGKTRLCLLMEANAIVKDWRAELLLNEISDDDKVSLIKWMAYINVLKALDLASITDQVSYKTIAWPDKPEQIKRIPPVTSCAGWREKIVTSVSNNAIPGTDHTPLNFNKA